MLCTKHCDKALHSMFHRTLKKTTHCSFHFTVRKKLRLWDVKLSLVTYRVGSRTKIWNQICLILMFIWLTTILYSKLVRKSSWLYILHIFKYIILSLSPFCIQIMYIFSGSFINVFLAKCFTPPSPYPWWAPNLDTRRLNGPDLHEFLAPHAESYLH